MIFHVYYYDKDNGYIIIKVVNFWDTTINHTEQTRLLMWRSQSQECKMCIIPNNCLLGN